MDKCFLLILSTKKNEKIEPKMIPITRHVKFWNNERPLKLNKQQKQMMMEIPMPVEVMIDSFQLLTGNSRSFVIFFIKLFMGIIKLIMGIMKKPMLETCE
ncbi:MAG: hypothetical protein ACTSRA_13025 [Promethearchaeota archaeon]